MSADPDQERVGAAVAVVTDYLEALNRGDYDAVRRLASDDFETVPATTGRAINLEQYITVHAEADAAFPDLRRHLESIEGRIEGDHVLVEAVVRVTATNDRTVELPSFGIGPLAPTGLRLEPPPHHDFFVVRNGLLHTYRSEMPKGGGLKGMIERIEAELAKREAATEGAGDDR